MKLATKQILTFLAIMLFLSAMPNALMIYVGRIDVGHTFAVIALMWCPGVAALITCALFKIKVSTLGWNFYPIKYAWLAYLLPILYSLPVYLIVWFFINGSFTYTAFVKAQSVSWGLPNMPQFATWAVAIPALMTAGAIQNLTAALGEEIGWRGFLLPHLNTRFGFTIACTISGIIWAMWHYLGILWFNYSGATPKVEAIICFTLMITAVSFILGYVRLKTGSIWPCAILHASHNLFIQSIFGAMTAQTGTAVLIAGEFGFGLVLTTGITAIWLWRKRDQLTV